jgi:hypothetical protein
MLRKQVIEGAPAVPLSSVDEIEIAAVATVLLTSEDSQHPVDHAFDRHPGPGGTCWVAGEVGDKTLVLALDAPQAIRHIIVEVEEPAVARTQELRLAISQDGERTYPEVLRQEYHFSPSGSAFEREDRVVSAVGVTHLRLQIRPDKGGQPCWASLTTLALWRGDGHRDIGRSEPPPELDQPTPFRLDVSPHQTE